MHGRKLSNSIQTLLLMGKMRKMSVSRCLSYLYTEGDKGYEIAGAHTLILKGNK